MQIFYSHKSSPGQSGNTSQRRNTDFDAKVITLHWFSLLLCDVFEGKYHLPNYKCHKVFELLWSAEFKKTKVWWHGRNVKKISHTLCYSWLFSKGVNADKRVSCETSLVFTGKPCTARLCVPCALNQPSSLACSPLPYGQRWYVHDRKDNILLSPRRRRVRTATHCLAGTNKSHI